MSAWLHFIHRSRGGLVAALFTLMTGFVACSTGCGSSAVPTGSNSAANGQQVIASGQPHMIGFRVVDALPPDPNQFHIDPNLGDIWFFATTNRTTTAGPAMTNIQVLVNGQTPSSSQVTVVPLPVGTTTNVKSVWIRAKGLAQGAQVQLDATVQGSARLSNTITVPAPSGYAAENKPPGFIPVQPAQVNGSTVIARPILFEFTHANPQNVSSYFSLVLEIQQGSGTNIEATPVHAVEMLQPTKYTAGKSFSGLIAAFLNVDPPAPSQLQGYVWNVVSLDSVGFGNGTSSDGGFLQGGTWIYFF